MEPAPTRNDHVLAADKQARSDKGFLWFGYIGGALIPFYGWGTAIYLAVSEKHANLRRHAIGIAAVALTAAAIYTVIIVNANKAHADHNVVGDLQTLLLDKGLLGVGNITCAHQAGDEYSCIVTQNGQPVAVQVTDDGQSIVEQGLAAQQPATTTAAPSPDSQPLGAACQDPVDGTPGTVDVDSSTGVKFCNTSAP